MHIKTIVVGVFKVNCFIVYTEKNEAIIIDPGSNAEKIKKIILNEKLTITHCFATHGHMDHISAMAQIVKEQNIKNVLMHHDDIEWAFKEENSMPPYYPKPESPHIPITLLADKMNLNIAKFKIEIIHTPGHSPGSISLYFPNNKLVFTGDTLFKNGVGRTDVPRSDSEKLGSSLKKLFKLPPETQVFPGHGEKTTIQEELGTLSLWN
jgi:glyoxylase-like metal-dependent hydrolase (beta-lactamase superfamily II)